MQKQSKSFPKVTQNIKNERNRYNFSQNFGAAGRTWTGTKFPSRDFKAYASKIDLNKNHKKQGIFSRKPPKNAPKSMISLYLHNLSVC